MKNLIKVNASYESINYEEIEQLDPSEVMNMLLEKRYQYIEMSGYPIKPIADKIYLFVESDAEFLVEGYLTLMDNLQEEKTTFSHFCCLNDGLLKLSADVNESKVEVTYNYYPGLDTSNLVSCTDKVTIDQYIFLWRRIVYNLLDAL